MAPTLKPLAEMIRTGGLSLPELFNRVRLRVNENTKGAQVPWDTQQVDTQFMFFDRAPDAPAPRRARSGRRDRDKPIRDLGVRTPMSRRSTRDTLQGYEDFLAAYPRDPHDEAGEGDRRGAPRGDHLAADLSRRHAGRLLVVSAALSARAACRRRAPPSGDPHGAARAAADVRHDRLRRAAAAAGRNRLCRPSGADFSDPDFDFAPPPPPPVYFLPPPPPDFVVLAPPPPPVGLFFLPQPLFVPIPVYVRPPVYVAAAAEQHHLHQHPQYDRHQ